MTKKIELIATVVGLVVILFGAAMWVARIEAFKSELERQNYKDAAAKEFDAFRTKAAEEVARLKLSLPSTIPVGTIVAFGGAPKELPYGWRICDGGPVSRAEFKELFNTIGIAWGTGDGTSTFNLPNLQGRFLRGVDAAGTIDPDSKRRKNAANEMAGVGSPQDDEFKIHTHMSKAPPWGLFQWTTGHADPFWDRNGSQYIEKETSPTGGSETRPKNSYVYYIIRVL